jgi:hypothetical protein
MIWAITVLAVALAVVLPAWLVIWWRRDNCALAAYKARLDARNDAIDQRYRAACRRLGVEPE